MEHNGNLLILADVTELVDRIKATCEAGIYPTVFMPNSKGKQIVLVRFDVKVMSNGVRKSFGPFYSYAAAVKAKWEYKRSGRAIKTEEEQQAIVEMGALINDISPKAKGKATFTSLDKMKVVHPLKEAKMQELSTLLLSIPSHKVVAEKQLEIVHPHTNAIHVVSAAEQKEWLEWYFNKDPKYAGKEQESTVNTGIKESIGSTCPHDVTQAPPQATQQNDEEQLEEFISPLIPDVQSVDDPEIQEMMRRIEEMKDEE
jgi:DNA-binding cell septation regulator SpoVG